MVENTDFVFLLRQTGFSKGNLSTHLQKLKAAGFITIQKEFLNNKPHTTIALNSDGRKAFEEYRAMMKQALDTLPDIKLEQPEC